MRYMALYDKDTVLLRCGHKVLFLCAARSAEPQEDALSHPQGAMPGCHSQPPAQLQTCPAVTASPLVLQLVLSFLCAQRKGETRKSSRKLYRDYF